MLKIVASLIIIIFSFQKLFAADIPIIVIAPSKKAQSISTVGTSVTVLDETFFKNSNEFFLGDALATTVMHQKNFSKEKFKVFHPGGNIGKSLLLAKDIMVSGKKMPTINHKQKFKEALKAYEILSLKYPEKISLFADQIIFLENKLKNV